LRCGPDAAHPRSGSWRSSSPPPHGRRVRRRGAVDDRIDARHSRVEPSTFPQVDDRRPEASALAAEGT
jgi:hypothetical protein